VIKITSQKCHKHNDFNSFETGPQGVEIGFEGWDGNGNKSY